MLMWYNHHVIIIWSQRGTVYHHQKWSRTRDRQSHLVAKPSKSITVFAIVVFVQTRVLGCFIQRATGAEAACTPLPATTATLLETLGLALGSGIMFRVRIRPHPAFPPNPLPFIAELGPFILWTARFRRDTDEHSQEHKDGEDCAFHHYQRCLFGFNTIETYISFVGRYLLVSKWLYARTLIPQWMYRIFVRIFGMV